MRASASASRAATKPTPAATRTSSRRAPAWALTAPNSPWVSMSNGYIEGAGPGPAGSVHRRQFGQTVLHLGETLPGRRELMVVRVPGHQQAPRIGGEFGHLDGIEDAEGGVQGLCVLGQQ